MLQNAKAREDLLALLASQRSERLDEIIEWCGSPIEVRLLLAIVQVLAKERDHYGGYYCISTPEDGRMFSLDDDPEIVRVTLQSDIEVDGHKYKADFLVTEWDCYRRRFNKRIVVEADGHDYHERTKEQAAKDRKRDRLMQGAGYAVLRFTGAEIYADAMGCADQILTHIHPTRHWTKAQFDAARAERTP